MSLIDQTYFVGDLTIAGLQRPEVTERINLFIQKYEDEFLRNVLGFPLYTAFLSGLSKSTVDQKWLDLLQGTNYQYGGRTRQWRGLIILPSSQTISISPAGQQVLIAGGPGTYDPVIGNSTLSLPPEFRNIYFTINRRGVGDLTQAEYTVAGPTLTLVGMPVWSNGETIILTKGPTIAISGAGAGYLSPIANYVYWHWTKDVTTQTVGLGEVATKGENSMIVSPAVKMARAWNELSEWMSELYKLMTVSQQIYPEWLQWNRDYSLFRTTNIFGI